MYQYGAWIKYNRSCLTGTLTLYIKGVADFGKIGMGWGVRVCVGSILLKSQQFWPICKLHYGQFCQFSWKKKILVFLDFFSHWLLLGVHARFPTNAPAVNAILQWKCFYHFYMTCNIICSSVTKIISNDVTHS